MPDSLHSNPELSSVERKNDFAFWTSPAGRDRAAQVVAQARSLGFTRAFFAVFDPWGGACLNVNEDMKYMEPEEYERRVEPLFSDGEYDVCRTAGGSGFVRLA